MNCGEIYLANYPFTDRTGGKVRPVLVVSRGEFNMGEDRLVVPISSNLDLGNPHTLLISANDPAFRATGLRCASAVKWTKVHVLSRAIAQRRLGVLAPSITNEVRAKIRSMFE